MSLIDRDAARAFMAGEEFKRSNTQVVVETRRFEDGSIDAQRIEMLLHGNVIATRFVDPNLDRERLIVTSAGWETVTTKARLNELPGVQVHQKKGVWYLNGERWEDPSQRTVVE